jgi:hypothetical protein
MKAKYLFCFGVWLCAAVTVHSVETLALNGAGWSATLDAKGALATFTVGGQNLLAASTNARLFTVNLRDEHGAALVVGSETAEFKGAPATDGGYVLRYEKLAGLPLDATVTIRTAPQDPLSRWRITLNNRSKLRLEWVEFPIVSVPNDLRNEPNGPAIFWSGNEGCLVTDAELRNRHGQPYRAQSYPSGGWCGRYPGPVQMQFMAYLRRGAGLYFASHDPQHSSKEIDYCRDGDHVRLIMKSYLEGAGDDEWRMHYDTVLGAIGGDWHDAAEIYRTWLETAGQSSLPPKLSDNKNLPAWFWASPIVATWPTRGMGHHAYTQAPNEFFPFTNALPITAQLRQELNAPILALLMQWEGTAPWAPPYVWPPMGGEPAFRTFVKGLHAQHNLAGVYCSGIAWTTKANTGDGTYERKADFDRLNLAREMCTGPAGEMKSAICNHESIRWGYDLCPARDFTREVIAAEAEKIARSGVDYIQLFDQNCGGSPCNCYAATHGHPPGPGLWQVDAMGALIANVRQRLDAINTNLLLGCEAAAADAYLRHLPLNDLRFNINISSFGRPVPAYAYVLHEYVNNFMGNQVQVGADHKKSPLNLLQRIAYSFTAGDLLSVVLKDKGEIHWNWCEKWDVPPPDQASAKQLLARLNAWRTGAGKPFLVTGRMLKPYPVEGTRNIPLVLKWKGDIQNFPSVFTTRWRAPDGREAQVLVNYLPDEEQTVTVRLPGRHRMRTLREPAVALGVFLPTAATPSIRIPPLSAVLLETQP